MSEKQFDLRGEIRAPKTGKVIEKRAYEIHGSKQYGTFYTLNGKCYAPNGDEISDPRLHGQSPVAAQIKPIEVIEAPKALESVEQKPKSPKRSIFKPKVEKAESEE